MNIDQAKHLSFPDLMEKLGHTPAKVTKGGNELWYTSPFRKEEEASLHISIGRAGFWIWKDFGDEGGTVIDFALRYAGVSGVSEALAFLDRCGVSPKPTDALETPTLFSFHPQENHRAGVDITLAKSPLELLSVEALKNPIILRYLTQERGLQASLLPRYLHEVRYRNNETGKEYFAFGMKNEAGGYEIRVATNRYSFKSALPTRDVTRIIGRVSGPESVTVFEGMTDFLSLLTMRQRDQPSYDAIIMHSLTSYPRTAAMIRDSGYETIHTYLDNNPAGRETTERFRRDFGAKVAVQSHQFAPHTDLNDALLVFQASVNSGDVPRDNR
ncbi:MAG: toprim domain-containing protein [Sediminibacterium sp.]